LIEFKELFDKIEEIQHSFVAVSLQKLFKLHSANDHDNKSLGEVMTVFVFLNLLNISSTQDV